SGWRDESQWTQVTTKRFHETNLQLRAQAGGVWIVTADNASPEHCPPSSYAGVIGPDGQWAAKTANPGTQYITHNIPLPMPAH
ncbi:MAG: hypothetical protein FWD83_08690, partial [Promicromonosporaceae bacterium]|nr:hypothetical protein [Promicromonosporaceae bacterium]